MTSQYWNSSRAHSEAGCQRTRPEFIVDNRTDRVHARAILFIRSRHWLDMCAGCHVSFMLTYLRKRHLFHLFIFFVFFLLCPEQWNEKRPGEAFVSFIELSWFAFSSFFFPVTENSIRPGRSLLSVEVGALSYVFFLLLPFFPRSHSILHSIYVGRLSSIR